MDFRVIHAYNRLVRRGIVDPLTCKHCGEEVAIRLSSDDQPLFQCFTCNSITAPGLLRYEEIKKIVEEHG